MRTAHVDRYYTSLESLLEIFGEEARKQALRTGTLDEYRIWKQETRTVLSRISGLERFEPCEPEAELMESVRLEGYRREKWLLRTEKLVWMPFYILIPDAVENGERLPVVVAPHGHGLGGKLAVAGQNEIPAVQDANREYNADYGLQFVKMGYMVFCPDARAFGERREWTLQQDDEPSFLGSTCIQLNHMAICLGRSVAAMWTWDLMRLMDFIETRKDCDSRRVACAGLSGGGYQTLWFSALDDRVKCAIVSGYFYGYRDSLLKMSHNCGCNYVPHLWEHVDMGDIGALIAPRPLLIETGDEDPLNGERGVANAAEQVAVAREAYRLFEAEGDLHHHVFHGPHRWDGTRAKEFFARYL